MNAKHGVAAILLCAACSFSYAAPEGGIASTGFNDDSGMQSDIFPNSPYAIGSPLAGAGLSEPGWAGPWYGGGGVQGAVVFEGDGAAQISPTTTAGRSWSEPQTGRFSIEQQVRFAPGARMVAYVDQSVPPGEIYQGPIWQAFPDGKFYVIDGIGDGAIIAPQEFSGFTWQPDTWYKVRIDVDFATSTWEFFVNDSKYNAPDPLGYRGTPAFLDNIRFLSEGAGPVYLDSLTIVPEPASVALLLGAALASAIIVPRLRR